jgi:processive 1,2-diacylglycerol beta-glucosyltransferase
VILILTAGFGDGHNTAARNVAAALARLAPGEEALVVDVFDEAHPLLAPIMKENYQMLITRAPSVWAWIYGRSAKLSFDGTPDILSGLRKAVARLLDRHKPRAVICTYPIYSKLFRQLKAGGRAVPPVYTVITDSISIHPIWFIAPSDACFVADEDSRQSALRLCRTDDEIHVAGFPVSLDFIETPSAEECASPHGRILYLPSTSVDHVARTLAALHPLIASGVKLTLPVGKHASRLYHVTTKFVDSLPGADIEIIGWTNRIPRLLQTHDLVICKAGGAILHEALAACCPAIIDYVVPGQEEGNAELLTRHDCGVTTRTPEASGEQAARLLSNNRAEARRMKANMRALSEPDASVKIASWVLQHAP